MTQLLVHVDGMVDFTILGSPNSLDVPSSALKRRTYVPSDTMLTRFFSLVRIFALLADVSQLRYEPPVDISYNGSV